VHAPATECIAKGKARTPLAFGVKVSVAVTATEGCAEGMRSMPGNPCDGGTLESALEQVTKLAASAPWIVLADRGCRGVTPSNPATKASPDGRSDDWTHDFRWSARPQLAQQRDRRCAARSDARCGT
jgi:IS5 family transposase